MLDMIIQCRKLGLPYPKFLQGGGQFVRLLSGSHRKNKGHFSKWFLSLRLEADIYD
jgi:hypothetical protein